MRTEPLDFIGIDYAVDNLGAAGGRLPNPEEVKRMVELVESLPSGG